MKSPLLFILSLVIACASQASAGMGPIEIVIDQSYKTESSKKTDTQNKSLKITVINNSRQDLTGLKVKYYFLNRDLANRSVSINMKGEKTADVKAVSKTLVETDTATAKSTQGKKGDTGQKIVGYALQVFDATGKLLLDRYEPLSLRDELAKFEPLPK